MEEQGVASRLSHILRLTGGASDEDSEGTAEDAMGVEDIGADEEATSYLFGAASGLASPASPCTRRPPGLPERPAPQPQHQPIDSCTHRHDTSTGATSSGPNTCTYQ